MMDGHEEQDQGRRTAALAALAILLALLIGGVILARALAHQSRLEDCLLAGRLSCEPPARR